MSFEIGLQLQHIDTHTQTSTQRHKHNNQCKYGDEMKRICDDHFASIPTSAQLFFAWFRDDWVQWKCMFHATISSWCCLGNRLLSSSVLSLLSLRVPSSQQSKLISNLANVQRRHTTWNRRGHKLLLSRHSFTKHNFFVLFLAGALSARNFRISNLKFTGFRLHRVQSIEWKQKAFFVEIVVASHPSFLCFFRPHFSLAQTHNGITHFRYLCGTEIGVYQRSESHIVFHFETQFTNWNQSLGLVLFVLSTTSLRSFRSHGNFVKFVFFACHVRLVLSLSRPRRA